MVHSSRIGSLPPNLKHIKEFNYIYLNLDYERCFLYFKLIVLLSERDSRTILDDVLENETYIMKKSINRQTQISDLELLMKSINLRTEKIWEDRDKSLLVKRFQPFFDDKYHYYKEVNDLRIKTRTIWERELNKSKENPIVNQYIHQSMNKLFNLMDAPLIFTNKLKKMVIEIQEEEENQVEMSSYCTRFLKLIK